MKIDTDTLTIIDDETIRMETNLPRQEFDGGRDKLEQFGWKIIEPHSLQTKITRRKANEAMLRKKINIDAGVTAFMDRTFAEGDIEISDPKMNVKSRLQRMWATSRPYLPYVGAVGAAVAGVVCAFFPGQVPILGPSLSQQVFNEFTFNLPIAATGAGIVFGTAQIVKSAAKSYEIPTKNLAQQAFDEAKLEWLSEKAEQFELYVPPEISNDPVEFERWLKAETQRKGLEFESDIPYHRIQWKGFKKYVKRTSGKWASSGINNREAVRRANEQFADLLRNELRETVQEWFPGTEMDQFLDMVMGDPLFIHHKFELDKPIDSFKKVESLLDLMYHIDNLMIKDLDDFQEARLDDLKGSLRKRIKDIIFEQDLLSGFSKYSKNLFERFYRK
ncbi:MAG: hypothetical protein ACOC4M_18200, partial [Promethearchaeia archaeon]